MDDAVIEDLYPPTAPHQALFTYSECYAQVERSMRIHRFGRLDSPEGRLVMFFCRLPTEDTVPRWLQMEVDPEVDGIILGALRDIRVPAALERRSWGSVHYNRSLRFCTRGASVSLWWDSMDSNLGDAIRPLCNAINSLVTLARIELEKCELVEAGDDENI